MARYIHGEFEGEAPDWMTDAEIREAVESRLPPWMGVMWNRIDDPD